MKKQIKTKDFGTIKVKSTGKIERISKEDWYDIIKAGNSDKFEFNSNTSYDTSDSKSKDGLNSISNTDKTMAISSFIAFVFIILTVYLNFTSRTEEPIYLISLIVSLASILTAMISAYKSNKNEKERLRNVFDDLEDFNADEIHLSVMDRVFSVTSGNFSAVGFDKNRKKICFINGVKDDSVSIYSFNDIMQSEIVIDGLTLVKTSTTSTIGRALVGGVLTGGIGAVIGGVTGKKSHNEVVNSIDLKICINDSANPFYKIRFLDAECKKGDFTYKDGYEKAEKWHGIVSTFIKQSEVNLNKNKSESSNVNDLLKLKELLDSDLLTREEFEEQKKKLLKQ